MNPELLHIVFAGGGTAGHLMPGLAVADALRSRLPRVRITFAGSGKPLERRLAAAADHEYLALPCRPTPRGPREAVAFLIEHFAGYWAARRFLSEEHVAAVVGLGGYASLPMGRAAVSRRLPLALFEQNAVPGRATRWLARRAAVVCLAFAAAEARLPRGPRVRLTGNPVRAGFRSDLPKRQRLVVLGGSGGARALNENVPKALYRLGGQLAGWEIIHQTGEADAATTAELYGKLGLAARVTPFLDDMPAVLNRAAVAVCRAGGTTLAELAAAGVPAVLVPYPHAADDHQRRNAKAMVAVGAATMIDERVGDGRLDHCLAENLKPLVDSPGRRTRMAWSLGRLARPHAAADAAEIICELAATARVQITSKAA